VLQCDAFPQAHQRALGCVAVCCSVLQCVAACCSVLQCVAVCCSVLQCDACQHAHQRALIWCMSTNLKERCTWMSTSASKSAVYECQHTYHIAMYIDRTKSRLFIWKPPKKETPPWGGSPTINMHVNKGWCLPFSGGFSSSRLFIWKPHEKETPPWGFFYRGGGFLRSTCMSTNATLSVKCACEQTHHTGWQRPIGCLFFIDHFLQKNPIISGSFAKNDLQLKTSYGSSPPCRALQSRLQIGGNNHVWGGYD